MDIRPDGVVELAGGPIEFAWTAGAPDRAPIVLLHEGLGCVTMWGRFPSLLAAATGRRVLSYSRHGYGGSGPARLPRGADYMHVEAREVLPQLLARLGQPTAVLVGHSDGASIALIAAAVERRDVDVVGVTVLAPHVFVEDRLLAAIRAIRQSYLADGRLRSQLGRHHRDPDATFWGWSDAWVGPEFRSWNIEALLPAVTAPVLIVQGDADAYGTLAQVDAVTAGVTGPSSATVLAGVGHAPHRECPAGTTTLVAEACASWP